MKEQNNYKLTPKNDLLFKMLFGVIGREEILKDFLEAILEIKIKKLELGKETILLPQEFNSKSGTLDILALLEDGTKINIEMQNRAHSSLKILEGQEIHFIELPKYRDKPDLNKKLEQWLAFLDYKKEELIEMATNKNEKVKKAPEEFDKLLADEKLKYQAYLLEKGRRDYESDMHAATKKATKKGKKSEKIKTAKKMLERNMEVKVISEITELSIDEIEKLK